MLTIIDELYVSLCNYHLQIIIPLIEYPAVYINFSPVSPLPNFQSSKNICLFVFNISSNLSLWRYNSQMEEHALFYS